LYFLGLRLPDQFDKNEWLITIVFAVFLFGFFRLPKRLPAAITVMVFLYTSFLSRTVDNLLASGFPVDLYDAADNRYYEWMDVGLWTLVYPLYGYYLVYFYQSWRGTIYRRMGYLLAASLLSVFCEAIALYLKIFHYKEWNIVLSLLIYPFLLGSILLFYESVLRRWITGGKAGTDRE